MGSDTSWTILNRKNKRRNIECFAQCLAHNKWQNTVAIAVVVVVVVVVVSGCHCSNSSSSSC